MTTEEALDFFEPSWRENEKLRSEEWKAFEQSLKKRKRMKILKWAVVILSAIIVAQAYWIYDLKHPKPPAGPLCSVCGKGTNSAWCVLMHNPLPQ